MIDATPRRTCLMCAQRGLTIDASTKLVYQHFVTASQPNAEQIDDHTWVCNGSGFPAAVGGDLDATRRYAIQKYRTYATQAAATRQKLVDALAAPKWRAADAIKHFAATVALTEQITRLWREAALASSLLVVVKSALGKLMPNTSSSSAIDRAIEEIDADAARQFMVEARREIERSYPDGLTADQTALILFDI